MDADGNTTSDTDSDEEVEIYRAQKGSTALVVMSYVLQDDLYIVSEEHQKCCSTTATLVEHPIHVQLPPHFVGFPWPVDTQSSAES